MTANNYQHILLATDLAADETYLHQRAQELAKQHNAKLTVVHVIPDIPPFTDMYGYFNAAELKDKIEADVETRFNKLAEKLNLKKEDLKKAHGNPKDNIIVLSEELNADLIVIGSHTRKGLTRLLGSTANSVIQHVDCDVFVVKCPRN